MPAAAVIPAPIAYIKVVAVKKARSWISEWHGRSAARCVTGRAVLLRKDCVCS